MPKAYVIGYRSRSWPDEAGKVDVDFAARLEKAYCWETRNIAEMECATLDRFCVEVVSKAGRKHTCTGFKVDEWASGKFVIFCEIPFLLE